MSHLFLNSWFWNGVECWHLVFPHERNCVVINQHKGLFNWVPFYCYIVSKTNAECLCWLNYKCWHSLWKARLICFQPQSGFLMLNLGHSMPSSVTSEFIRFCKHSKGWPCLRDGEERARLVHSWCPASLDEDPPHHCLQLAATRSPNSQSTQTHSGEHQGNGRIVRKGWQEDFRGTA